MKRFLLAGAATSLVLVGITRMEVDAQKNPDRTATEKREPAGNMDRAKQLKSLVAAARDTSVAITDEHLRGRGEMEEVYVWSNRWRAAAVKAAETKDEVLRANTDHRARMQKLHTNIKTLNDQGIKGGEHDKLRAAEFFLTEAELLLSESELASFAMRSK